MHAWNITGQIRGKNTLTTYRFVLKRFARRFGKSKIADITSEGVFSFLADFTEQAIATRRESRPFSTMSFPSGRNGREVVHVVAPLRVASFSPSLS